MKVWMVCAIAAPIVVGAGYAYWDGSADQIQRRIVKLHLNDPDSAQFRNTHRSSNDKDMWCGEVNAKNRLGGMVGFSRYILRMPDADLELDGKANLDSTRALSNVLMEGSDGFDYKWSLWCTKRASS